MITREDTVKINRLMEDEVFVKKVFNAGSEEGIIRLFDQEGILLSKEDLRYCEESARNNPELAVFFQDDELSEEALEIVSGGSTRKWVGLGIMLLGIAVAVSTGVVWVAAAGGFISAAGMFVHGGV